MSAAAVRRSEVHEDDPRKDGRRDPHQRAEPGVDDAPVDESEAVPSRPLRALTELFELRTLDRRPPVQDVRGQAVENLDRDREHERG